MPVNKIQHVSLHDSVKLLTRPDIGLPIIDWFAQISALSCLTALDSTVTGVLSYTDLCFTSKARVSYPSVWTPMSCPASLVFPTLAGFTWSDPPGRTCDIAVDTCHKAPVLLVGRCQMDVTADVTPGPGSTRGTFPAPSAGIKHDAPPPLWLRPLVRGQKR